MVPGYPSPAPNMLAAIVIPIVATPIAYLFGKRMGRVGNGVFSFLALAIATALLWWDVGPVIQYGQVREVYSWVSLFNMEFGLLADWLSFPIAIIILSMCTLSAVYSIAYMEHEPNQENYFAFLLLFSAGMVGVILSTNLIQFYLFWELMLIPSYFLIAHWGTGRPKVIGFKYFLFTHAGAACLIFGILWLFVVAGTFNLYELPLLLIQVNPSILRAIMILMFIGFAVKMAIFPFHSWLPDAHAEAPTPISVLLSGVMIKCGVYATARIALTFLPGATHAVAYGLSALAVVTMLWGGFMALAQTDIKRLLAYSSISQMGYILFGLVSYTMLGVAGGLFHIINHAIAKGLLFMCAGAIIHQTGIRDLKQLGGLAGKMPVTAVACLIGALSIAGTPPLGGFASEWMIFFGGFQSGYTALAALAILATIITAGYYLWMIKRVFFGEKLKGLEQVREAPLTMLAPMVILTFFVVIFGIYPTVVLQMFGPAAQQITQTIGGP